MQDSSIRPTGAPPSVSEKRNPDNSLQGIEARDACAAIEQDLSVQRIPSKFSGNGSRFLACRAVPVAPRPRRPELGGSPCGVPRFGFRVDRHPVVLRCDERLREEPAAPPSACARNPQYRRALARGIGRAGSGTVRTARPELAVSTRWREPVPSAAKENRGMRSACARSKQHSGEAQTAVVQDRPLRMGDPLLSFGSTQT
jgi:hypothetical protein